MSFDCVAKNDLIYTLYVGHPVERVPLNYNQVYWIIFMHNRAWCIAFEHSLWRTNCNIDRRELINCVEGGNNSIVSTGATAHAHLLKCIKWRDVSFIHSVARFLGETTTHDVSHSSTNRVACNVFLRFYLTVLRRRHPLYMSWFFCTYNNKQ